MGIKRVKIRDLTLRDGQQSQFATRMNQDQVNRVLPLYNDAEFYAMEVWGGAVPDSTMRFLNENPWDRLEIIKKSIGDKSLLTALSRGRNLFGYNPYSDGPIEGFLRNSVKSGIDIMRIFDALNDMTNIKSNIEFVHQNKALADCALCYTVDSKFTFKDKLKLFFSGKGFPKKIFTVDYFVEKAKVLEEMGADIITIKDMAGLITPAVSSELISKLKKTVKVPINFHTHCTPGYGLASTLAALMEGVDIIDTAIWNFAGGPAAPAFEFIQIFCDKLGIDTGVNREKTHEINKILGEIREELKEYDKNDHFPLEFNITNPKIPAEIDSLFDNAIKFTRNKDFNNLLKTIHKIEKYYKFPEPNETVKNAQIPGGMYTNMLSQLQMLKLDHLLETVLKTVPRVRWDAGSPPLVTPTSQIVGAQAVNCVISQNNKKDFYSNKSTQFVNLVKGSYGKTPVPINPDFRGEITGDRREQAFNQADYVKPQNPLIEEYGHMRLAHNEKEELLIELFPNVAVKYLKDIRGSEYEKLLAEKKKNNRDKDDEMWDNLIGYA